MGLGISAHVCYTKPVLLILVGDTSGANTRVRICPVLAGEKRLCGRLV